MSKRSKILLCGIIVLAIVLCVLIGYSPTTLPPSFTINLASQSSSSGGSHYYNASFTFVNNTLVSGSSTLLDEFGGGCRQNCNQTYYCSVTNDQLIDSTGKPCDGDIVPTKAYFESQIQSGNIHEGKSCDNDTMCYTVTKPFPYSL